MKRLSKEEKAKQKRAVRRVQRAIKRALLRETKARRRGKRLLEKQKKDSRFFASRKFVLPETVCITTKAHRRSLLDLLHKIRSAALDGRISSVYIDFSKIKMLHPSGTILLLAELERLMECDMSRRKLIPNYPEDEVVEQLFQHVGLLERFGLENRIEKVDHESVVNWMNASGTEGDFDAVAELLPSVLIEGANTELRLAVTTGMAEAIANSSEHAYVLPRNDGNPSPVNMKWWAFAREKDGIFWVVICDLGAGIPRTLRRTWPEEAEQFLMRLAGKKSKDHSLIELALKLGRTRTEEGSRGKGLKDILKVVKNSKVGVMEIHSNNGIFGFDGELGKRFAKSHKKSIGGTIVQWSIPVEEFNRIHRHEDE